MTKVQKMNDCDKTKNSKKLEVSSSVASGTIPDLTNKSSEKTEMSDTSEEIKSKYTPKQKLYIFILVIGDFCAGLLASLQAPFFPEEAEKKGATATEYGFIFGIYNMTIVLAAPLMGKLVVHFSPKFILNSGYFVLGTTSILFGILDLVSKSKEFVVLALIVRISEGIGAACVTVAAGTIVASEFNDNLGATYAILEMSLGVAIILGPVLGAGLYELGGFKLPFLSIGCVILIDAIAVLLILPEAVSEKNKRKATKFRNLFKAWIKPQILVFAFSIFSTFAFIGFNIVGLELHMEETKISKLYIGMIFSMLGVVYVTASPFWGWINDKKCRSSTVNFLGCCFHILALLCIGPAPFIPLKTNVYIICIGMASLGIATGAKTVSSFTGSLYAAKKYGFPDDLSTYGIVASIITSSKSLGSALGPSFGGFLIDNWGFRLSSAFYLITELLLVVVLVILMMSEKGSKKIFRITEEVKDVKESVISLDIRPLSSKTKEIVTFVNTEKT